MADNNRGKINYLKLWTGLGCIGLYILLTSLPTPDGLPVNGQKALALMVATIVAWTFEIVPIGIASALAVMLLPVLKIVPMMGPGSAMATFAIPTIFFILSSFCFAAAFIGTGLGYRCGLSVSGMFGKSSSMVLLAFMVATAVISAALADIPTAIVFASIAYPILQKNNCMPGKSNFGAAMMMGIPIAAAIGGFGTPAGSGMNVLSLNLLKNTANVDVNFLQWSIVGIPFAAILTLIAWYVLIKMVPPEIDYVQGLEDVQAEREKLGPMTGKEKIFCVIFGITLILWFTSIWTNLDIAVISMIASTILFFPGIQILTWDDVKGRVGWDVLFLVGASNALAMAMTSQRASAWLANVVLGDLVGAGAFVLLVATIAFGIFSHLILPVGSAALAVSIPVISLIAAQAGISPALMVVPLAYTASCVFLLPLDPIPLTTFQYGYWKITDMMKPGLVISVIWLVLLVMVMHIAGIFGIF